MKTFTAYILAISLIMTSSLAQANENGVNGLILGAGSGALIGQTIGRNTEATLIGTAVGSMFGYIIGNEMDKDTSRSRVAYRAPRRQYEQPRYVKVIPPRQTRPEPICRETEMLAEIDGWSETVYGTACLENGKWVIINPELHSQTIIIEKNKHRQSRRKNHMKRGHRHSNRRVIYRSVW